MAPFLMMLGGVVIFGESFNRAQQLAAILLFGSLLLFFNERLILLLGMNNDYTFGVFFIVISAIVWAVYALAQKQLLLSFSSMQIMFMIYVICTLIVTPLSQPFEILEVNTLGLVCLAVCCLNTLIAYGAFAEALEHWEASRVSAVLATTPLITIASVYLFAYFWDQAPTPDDLNWIAYAGAVGVVIGSVITAIGGKAPPTASSRNATIAENQ